MKIVMFEVEEWEKETFRKLEEAHEVEFTHERLTKENASRFSGARIISPFIYSDLDAQVLRQFGNLKLIATRSTGFDHIAMDVCGEKGITVCNVPSYGEHTVAEHVFGLLLAISHNLVEAVDRTRRGDFSQVGLEGFDLRGKTMGVIGTGDIGKCVINIAAGFSMQVLAFDVRPDLKFAENRKFQYVDFDELLGRSDIITLHVPANEKTRNLIDEKAFNKMKNGVILINTARGTVVKVQAMVRALSEGKLKAAGLDVLPEEPVIREEAELLRSIFRKEQDMSTLLSNHILLRLRNVVITPHSAFNTREAVQRILDTTLSNIVLFLKGSPENVAGRS